MSRDALVVGINNYDYSRWNLTAPAADAEEIARLLETYGEFRVRRLPAVQNEHQGFCVSPTSKVTTAQLEKALLDLFRPKEGDCPQTALLFFSGHGFAAETLGVKKGYLATSDSKPLPNQWGIPLQNLRELLQASPVREQIIWLDCCHAGELMNVDDANPGEQSGYSRCFIASSRGFEKSFVIPDGKYSVLTEALLQGLEPRDPRGEWVTNYSLIDAIVRYLKSHHLTIPQRPKFTNIGQVINLTRKFPTGSEQSPNPIKPEEQPYKGLEAFDCQDAQYFYGRRELTDELLQKIWRQNFLAVLGPSGSGKSSAVRAGLVYEISRGLRQSGTAQWHVLPVIKPGERPLESLAEAFISPEEPQRRAQRLRASYLRSLEEKGAAFVSELVADYEDATAVVLVVDQFEEVFTLSSPERQRAHSQFLHCLLAPLELPDSKLRVVITIRADFYGKCLERDYAGLGEKIKQNSVAVVPMKPEELQQAITKPAELVGLTVEPELVAQIREDVQGSPGSLPLLEYALTELWDQWRQGWQQQDPGVTNQLTLTAYRRLGGVKGALEIRAEQVYLALAPQQQQIAEKIFVQLTQLGDGTEHTRRRVGKQELITEGAEQSLVERVLGELTDARLVVLDEKRANDRVEVVVEVAHEALIRHWSRLGGWIEENREAIELARKIQAAAREWDRQGRSEDGAYLWQGSRLAEAQEYLQQDRSLGYLDSLAQEFIQVSTEVQQKAEQIKALPAIFASMTDLVFVFDAEGRYLEIAPTKPVIMSQPEGMLIGDRMSDVFPIELTEIFLSCIEEALSLNQTVDCDYCLPIGENGEDVWFAAAITPISADRVLWVARDITAYMQTQEELLQYKRHLEDLVQQLTARANAYNF